MSPKTRRGLVWFGFIFSLFCVLIAGIDMSFNVYALSLKDTFNLDQTQVEIVASTGTVGLGLTFLEPLLSGRFGYPATFLVTFLLSPVTSGLLAWASRHGHYFHSKPVYIYILHLLMCTSNTMVSVSLIGANIKIFARAHSGKIIGLMNAVNCVGEMVYGGLMQRFFSGQLSGFFLTISICSVVFLGTCYITLYPLVSSSDFKKQDIQSHGQYEEIKGETNPKVSLDDSGLYQRSGDVMSGPRGNTSEPKTSYQGEINGVSILAREANATSRPEESSTLKGTLPLHRQDSNTNFLSMLRDRFFHLSTWPAILFYASTFTCMNNITSIAASVGVHDTMVTVYVISASIMVVRIGFGLAFDRLASEMWGIVLMIISYVSFATAMLIGMFWLDYPGAIYVASALAGVGMGPSITIPLSLVVLRYGRRHFQAAVGLLFVVTAFAQISLQMMFGVIYDAHETASTRTDYSCVGKDCFYLSFAVLLAITGLVTLIQLANLFLMFLERRSSVYVVEEKSPLAKDA